MTYYNTLCSVVEGLANHYGHKVKCTAATNGGYTLIRNAKADNVITAIQKGGYDKVIIQDIVEVLMQIIIWKVFRLLLK